MDVKEPKQEKPIEESANEKVIELNEDQLKDMSGGALWDVDPNAVCPKCGCASVSLCFDGNYNFLHYTCKRCYHEFRK